MLTDNVLMGRVATVIGGGGGIGVACARALAQAGAKVAIVDRLTEPAASAAASFGGHSFVADVGDEVSLSNALEQIQQAIGGVDILINAAAVFQAPVPASMLRMEKWDEVVRVSQRGTYLACILFGKAMADRGGGAIVNIASVAGMRSLPLHAYGPAKAAVISLTESLAAEWGPAGVRVNALSPGFTRTPAVDAAIRNGTDVEGPILPGTALGRLVEPEEVAQAALFLASPAASAITGINLPVDCGWLVGTPWQAYGGLRTPDDHRPRER